METNTRMDRIIVGTAAIAISGAILPLIFKDPTFSYKEGSPGYELALGACYIMAGLYALAHFRQVKSLLTRSRALVMVLILALLSALWAESSGLALRRALALFGTMIIGALLAVRFTMAERLKFLSYILRALAVASLLFALLLPSYGVTTDDPLHIGDWTGVFGNKNRLGSYVALALLIDCFRPMRIQYKAFWFLLYIVILVKSGSASPMAALLATWIIIKLFNHLRTKNRLSVRAIVFSIVGGMAACIVAGFGTGVFQVIFGRSADLTGRTELWRALVPAILIHPLLGYGYGSFWGGASKEFYTVLSHINWVPMYSHNGFLEVMISLGLVGLVLVCWFLVQGGIYAVRQADFRETVQDLFPLTLLVYYLIRNVTECTLLYLNSFEWALLAGTLLAVMPEHSWRRRSFEAAVPEETLLVAKEYA